MKSYKENYIMMNQPDREYERIITDKDEAYALVGKHISHIEYLSDELKNDKDIIMQGVYSVLEGEEAILYASKALRKNKTFLLEVISVKPYALEYFEEKFKDDRKIVELAVRISGNALKYASPRLQNDKKIVYYALKQNLDSLSYASREIKDMIGKTHPLQDMENILNSEKLNRKLQKKLDTKTDYHASPDDGIHKKVKI